MNELGYSEMEAKVIDVLKQQYGKTFEAMDETEVQSKIDASKKLYESSVKAFRSNQSAHNYNLLITSMIALQYWNQKKVKSFSTSEDF